MDRREDLAEELVAIGVVDAVDGDLAGEPLGENTRLAPRSTKNVARVTMKLGSPVRLTSVPFSHPMHPAAMNAAGIAIHIGSPRRP